MDKNAMFEEIVYAPVFDKINFVIPLKTREIIFDTAWDLYKKYDTEEYYDELTEISEQYNLLCTYDKLINMYLKLHPELDLR